MSVSRVSADLAADVEENGNGYLSVDGYEHRRVFVNRGHSTNAHDQYTYRCWCLRIGRWIPIVVCRRIHVCRRVWVHAGTTTRTAECSQVWIGILWTSWKEWWRVSGLRRIGQGLYVILRNDTESSRGIFRVPNRWSVEKRSESVDELEAQISSAVDLPPALPGVVRCDGKNIIYIETQFIGTFGNKIIKRTCFEFAMRHSVTYSLQTFNLNQQQSKLRTLVRIETNRKRKKEGRQTKRRGDEREREGKKNNESSAMNMQRLIGRMIQLSAS